MSIAFGDAFLPNAQAIDKEHLWHPYTSMIDPLPTYPVVAAAGVELTLADGRRLIDGMSSWWAAIHGYNHPQLNAAAHQQIDQMAHVMFGGITHPPAVALADRLVKITPAPLRRVFIADSGSISIEVAIKMAVQYWQARKETAKTELLTIRGGYHGDTFAAMSVCDPVNGMHHLFKNTLIPQRFVARPETTFEQPWDDTDIAELAQQLARHHQSIAAVVLEPIVQGAGGMRFYHSQYLREVRQLCDRYDVLLIADEIATGFGRSGKLFACEHAAISPDIMCVGKALTGGYMTLAATLTTDDVALTISRGEGGGALMHGPTFMGNPLACAVAVAAIDTLMGSDWQSRVAAIEQQLCTELLPLKQLQSVADVRVLGAIGVVEMRENIDVASAQQQFVEAGVWIRPFGRLLYIMPPYIINAEQLSRLTQAMADYANDVIE
ncbi:adenosylmethionine--8-amino-7-oxononanoate transaminase [Idiomarina tyrosinivorans]|uniref:Adenosylmethionine-8-amino-7-oxononanoate aminotransferase n=1 Tax=Idiomarina tyrosinivorans TaxID=1445662 RepID=A0A432ZU28_9GAMM|nr:adenosylmethionine--8-amino-7-oxononanoate transaminase [Idiomarina tyrosinivorans]RUO81342.1 adenosylmethionine--8-amino-7-oxononanoate transaminase [Idiomarina tyrosinivorans]